MIYLDNAATSWPKPESVCEVMTRCLREYGANPGRGGHRLSLQAGRALLETRELVAELFGVKDSAQIVFTLNVTEALNLAIKGVTKPGDHILISGMEHNAVARPAFSLAEKGIETTVIPCSPEGLINPADVANNIRENTKLICVNHASNVTGTIQPINQIGKIARERGVLFLVDCAQTAGVYPIDVNKSQIDLLAFTGHKGLLGPQGTGGLYIREGVDVTPLKQGGTGSHSELMYQPEVMPDKFESGTPNTVGLVGLGAGIKFILEEGMETIRRHEQMLTKELLRGLREREGVTLYGPQDIEQQTAVVSLNINGQEANEVSFILDQVFDIATRAGLHCAPLAHQTIGTLETGTVRLSPGYFNTLEEIKTVLDALATIEREGSSHAR